MNTRVYLWSYLALLVLTLLTFGLSFAPLGAGATPVALLIASAKAWVVAMFFMHLREHEFANKGAIIVGVLLAALLIGFAAADVATRDVPVRLTPAQLDRP